MAAGSSSARTGSGSSPLVPDWPALSRHGSSCSGAAARFNGVVHVNWQNVSGGFELGAADFESEQLLDGFAWVGVSAQRVGVYGLPGGEQFGLRGWDPERYGRLDHPGDDFSFDIFTQAARAIGPAILGGAKARRLVASGASQSALRLRTYANAIQPMERLFDCFLFLLDFR